jgi:predicted site-specific integrase-resolvase
VKEFLNTKETLDYLKISRAKLYEMINEGLIQTYKLAGGKISYFKHEELLALFKPGTYSTMPHFERKSEK